MAGIRVICCLARIDLISCIDWCAPNYRQAGEKKIVFCLLVGLKRLAMLCLERELAGVHKDDSEDLTHLLGLACQMLVSEQIRLLLELHLQLILVLDLADVDS